MVLRDKRLWWGVTLAVILAFVSYAVVASLGTNPDTANRNVSDTDTQTSQPGTSTSSQQSAPPVDGDVTIPAVVGQRLNQAKANLTLVGLTNIDVQDATHVGPGGAVAAATRHRHQHADLHVISLP